MARVNDADNHTEGGQKRPRDVIVLTSPTNKGSQRMDTVAALARPCGSLMDS